MLVPSRAYPRGTCLGVFFFPYFPPLSFVLLFLQTVLFGCLRRGDKKKNKSWRWLGKNQGAVNAYIYAPYTCVCAHVYLFLLFFPRPPVRRWGCCPLPGSAYGPGAGAAPRARSPPEEGGGRGQGEGWRCQGPRGAGRRALGLGSGSARHGAGGLRLREAWGGGEGCCKSQV